MEKALTRSFLKKILEVIIDRPLGSSHPRFSELIYPVNYGYIANTISGDGMELDVYVLGLDRPVERFKGSKVNVLLM